MIKQNLFNNRYEIGTTLGRGGMGEVFLAADLAQNSHQVAVKIIKPEMTERYSDEVLKQFKQEYDIMTRLKHPNLARVHDFGQNESGHYFIVMEYLDGITLRKYLIDKTELTIQEILALIIPLLRAFEFIHSRDIIYRDIKPDNVMLRIKDGLPIDVKLLDFGLADLGGAENNRIKGTLHYLAPEVLNGGELDNCSDIFSLGILLYELLAGGCLYSDTSIDSILNSVSLSDRYYTTLDLGLQKIADSRFTAILKRMLAYRKEERFFCCSEIIDEFSNLFGLPIASETPESQKSYILGVNFVGRLQELDLLKKQLAKRDTVLTVVSGSSGIGKSRLINEFSKYCTLEGLEVYAGNSFNSLSYEPFLEIMGRLILNVPVDRLPAMSGYLKLFYPCYANLQKFQQPTEINEKTARAVLVQLFCDLIVDYARNSARVIVMVFSNFHNIDEISLQIIDSLLIKISLEKKTVNLMLICENRTGESSMTDHFIQRNIDKKRVNQIELQPFNENEIKDFVENTFGKKSLHASLTQSLGALGEKAGGNPFFLQEYLRNLSEQNILVKVKTKWCLHKKLSAINVPASLKIIIAERINKLDFSGQEQKAFKLLAILHRQKVRTEFMSRLDPETDWQLFLEKLTDNELAVENYGEYTAANQIIGEVIRDGILEADQIALHADLAVKLEKLFTEGRDTDQLSDEELEVLGHHYQAASRGRQPDMLEKCAEYFKKLSFRYRERSNNKKSLHYFGLLRDMLKANYIESDAKLLDYIDILRHYGVLLSNTGNNDEALKVSAECLELAESRGLTDKVCDMYLCIGTVYFQKSDFKLAMDYATRTLKLIGNDTVSAVAGSCYTLLGKISSHQGNLQESLDCFKKNHAIQQKIKDGSRLAESLENLGIINNMLGNSDDSLKYYHEVAKIYKEQNNPHVCVLQCNIGVAYYDKMDYPKALKYYKQSLLMAETIGYNHLVAIDLGNIGTTLNSLQKPADGRRYLEKSIRMAEEIGYKLLVVANQANLADSFTALKQHTKAEQILLSGMQLAKEIGAGPYVCRTAIKLFQLLHDADRPLDVSRHLAEVKGYFSGEASADHKFYFNLHNRVSSLLAQDTPGKQDLDRFVELTAEDEEHYSELDQKAELNLRIWQLLSSPKPQPLEFTTPYRKRALELYTVIYNSTHDESIAKHIRELQSIE